MRGLLLTLGAAFMGLDLYAQVFDSVADAKDYFKGRYQIEYDEYVELFGKVSEDLELTDEEQYFVENTQDLFWCEERYAETIDTSMDPVQQVAIFEVGENSTMVIGQGMF